MQESWLNHLSFDVKVVFSSKILFSSTITLQESCPYQLACHITVVFSSKANLPERRRGRVATFFSQVLR
jgi:hypothetical protein